MKVIFVFAHPDDESFSSSGTIYKLTQKGVDVKLITATRGEAGSLGNPPLTTSENLAKFREKELKNAAKIMGISQIFFLDYEDGKLKTIPVKEIKNKILSILSIEKPDIVITFNKEGVSKHPDHIHLSKAATLAFSDYLKNIKKSTRLYYIVLPKSLLKKLRKEGIAYNAFGEIKGTPDSYVTTKVDISDVIEKKIKAIKSHKTQHQDWERYFKRVNHEEFKYEFFQLVFENGI